MATLDLPDLTLWYERFGTPDPARRLLVFNGSGATIEASRPLIDKLAEHFDLAVHDQRCLGRTGLPPTRPTMADYAADARALVDHLGWDRFAVFGISFGGMVAQEFTVTHPERVARLALLCTSPGGAGGSSYPLHELVDLDAVERDRIALHNLDTRYDEAFLADHSFDRMIVDGMRARGGVLKHLFYAVVYLVGLGSIIALSSYSRGRFAQGILSFWMYLLIMMQSGMALLYASSRIAAAIRRDLQDEMIDSIRLMPLPSSQAVLGYIFAGAMQAGAFMAALAATQVFTSWADAPAASVMASLP